MSEPSESVTMPLARILSSQNLHSFMVGINALNVVGVGVMSGSVLVSGLNSTFN